MAETCGEIEVVENPSRGGGGLWLVVIAVAALGGWLRSKGDL